MYYCYMDSPIGELLLAGDDDALTMIGFPKGAMRRDPEGDWIYKEKPFAAAISQLNEYFAGERHDFDLPLKSVSIHRRIPRNFVTRWFR